VRVRFAAVSFHRAQTCSAPSPSRRSGRQRRLAADQKRYSAWSLSSDSCRRTHQPGTVAVMPEGNPFLDPGLAEQVEEVVRVATDPRMLERVAALPSEPKERVKEIRRSVRVADVEDLGVDMPEGLRLSARWFEPPEEVSSATRFVPQIYINGYGPGGPPPAPRPPRPHPSPGGPTVCGSVGVVVCASVGG
jgi:hypothetical protein